MEKSVKIKRTVYTVKIEEDRVEVDETEYPKPGWGNNFGTTYILDLAYSKRWAKKTVECYNNTWACRGHGMTAYWVEDQDFIPRSDAEQKYQEIRRALEEAEDGTPDIKAVADKFVAYPDYTN